MPYYIKHFAQHWGAMLHKLLVMPFPFFMLLLCLGLGVTSNLGKEEVLHLIVEGFGAPLGEIALILIPSFVLSSSISQSKPSASSGVIAKAIAPLAGASMVCPDTAYAALSPIAAERKLSVLFGAYAGFKLLIPAGPAIVAATLGGLTPKLIGWGAMLFIFSWITGLLFAGLYEKNCGAGQDKIGVPSRVITVPMTFLIGLIVMGGLTGWLGISMPLALEFFLDPKGALIIAAGISLIFVDLAGCKAAFESSINRTAPLLLMIGAASALGSVLVAILPFEKLAQSLVSSGLVIPALFLLTASFKLAKGSSMATYAGTGGLVSAILPNLNVSTEAAILAMCAGAFVTIAPNDSLYWQVRHDAFKTSEQHRATWILGMGATLQGLTAFLIIQTAVWFGIL